MRALIIDDEAGIRLPLTHFLAGRGYETAEAATGADGLATARTILPDIVFLDQRLPDCQGEEILRQLVAPEIGACVIMMTAYVEIDQAVRAMKQGAEYFFPKPFDLAHLAMILESVESRHKLKQEILVHRTLQQSGTDTDIIGRSPGIISAQRLISLLAANRTTPVLIFGESGSGKELAARAIHRLSGISGPLVEINSATLSENLLESELFGHEKGAFTDAAKTKSGLFEVAENGTIFFDELGEMPLAIQAKLLKVLDTKTYRRVGGVADLKTNARFMGATNKNLPELVKRGEFREDLFYRINVLPVQMPPLRERGTDIVLLAEHFIRTLGAEMGRTKLSLADSVLAALAAYRWPGNVRELRNVIERALILAEGKVIDFQHLPGEIKTMPAHPPLSANSALKTLQQAEDAHIKAALEFTKGNHSRTAALLGISRSTLLLKLKKLQEN